MLQHLNPEHWFLKHWNEYYNTKCEVMFAKQQRKENLQVMQEWNNVLVWNSCRNFEIYANKIKIRNWPPSNASIQKKLKYTRSVQLDSRLTVEWAYTLALCVTFESLCIADMVVKVYFLFVAFISCIHIKWDDYWIKMN